ncbi:MAG: glycosyltransferase [Gammaproteobacteria bacterium]|nr:glycosyltransferase [Gammaproteobacteria bacterium]
MRILLVTYANRNSSTMGVGRYYNKITDILEKNGHELIFFNHPTPLVIEETTLKSTLIPIFSGILSKKFEETYSAVKPDAIHIQSEVGLGISSRQFCVKHEIPYTSSYHTNWDIGMQHWAHCPSSLVWKYLRWFYEPAALIHAGSSSIFNLLRNKNILNPIEIFPLGVDRNDFFYDPDNFILKGYKRPYFMSLSRISKEKNLESFLDLSLPGTKFVIGNGPYKKHLQKIYGDKAVFLPYENVRKILSQGDVFVFPSRYDTFGLTNLEALACGLPIAAYPVMGPIDIIEQGLTGFTSENLAEAALACLGLKKEDCIAHASKFTWEQTAQAFLKHQIKLT